MARTLYRIYLYFVLTVLLIFSAITSSMFLGDLFRRIAGYTDPYGGAQSASDFSQHIALAAVALVVTAIFGGLHFWLIRRDIAHDAGASRGAVRAFFLNFVEAISAIVVAVAGTTGFSYTGQYGISNTSDFGPAVAFGILFALLELERRRGQPDRGGALVLQRLHFYGIQFILLLFVMASNVLNALYQTVIWLIIHTGYASNPCLVQPQYGGCYYQLGQQLGSTWLAALWTVLIWAGYSVLARTDYASRLRAVFRFLGLAFGVYYILDGFQQGVQSLLRQIFHVPTPYLSVGDVTFTYNNALIQFAFVNLLIFGIFVTVVYWFWLRSDARHGGVMDAQTTRQSMVAVAAALSAFPFWGGIALTLGGLVERVVAHGSPPDGITWAGDVAAIVAGAIYVPLALWLGARARQTGISTPRRAFVYVLLALGTLGAVISLIFVLYAFVSNAIGSPLNNWQPLARQGVVNVIVGAVLVGIYVFIARREGWFARQPTHADAATPAVAQVETVESVLDELLARRLTRDEAAARIRALTGRPAQ